MAMSCCTTTDRFLPKGRHWLPDKFKKCANDLALKLMDELRNPLTAIGGFARRITKQDCTSEKLSEYSDIILEQSQKLDAALNRALNYLRSTSEKPKGR